MQLLLGTILLASAALAAPVASPEVDPVPSPSTSSTIAAYTAAIDPVSPADPPPLWDPQSLPPPSIFDDAPREDTPAVPLSLLSVHEAPVQAVRVEKLSPFTASKIQPVFNIYAPSPADEEGKFAGEGSLRPAVKGLGQSVLAFLGAWAWWIAVICVACALVYVVEKMLIGVVRSAKRARSVSRVARSRAASLVVGTRNRAASIVQGGRGRAGTFTKGKWSEKAESSRSPPPRSRSWDETMV